MSKRLTGFATPSKREISRKVRAGFFKRRVVAAHGAKWPFGGNPPNDLDALVKQRVKRLARAEVGTGHRVVLGVTVERRDGMTWDAERTRAHVAAGVERDWSLRWLSGSDGLQRGPLDELAAVFGGRAPVRRAARNSGVVPGGRRDWGIWGLMSTLAVVCIVGGILISDLALKAGTGPGAVVGALAAAALALLARNVEPQRLPLASNKLEEAVKEDPTGSDLDVRFAEQLHRELRAARGKRAIVIDDYGLLRRRTVELIDRYLEDPGNRGDEELWIIFERGSRTRAGGKHQPGSRQLARLSIDESFETWRCRQQPLTVEDKRRLVRNLHPGPVMRRDRRLRFRAVADVVSDKTDDTLTKELLGQLRGADAGSVRAFALLALAATVPEPERLKPRDVVSALRGSSPREDAIEQLLGAWFPGEQLRPAAIQDETALAMKEFDHLFEERPRRRGDLGVRVSTAYADALVQAYPELREAHKLPYADAGRAFWALLWHRRLSSASNRSAPVTERLISQICALREPAQIRDRYGVGVARALCEAGIFATEAALALGVSGIVADTPVQEDEIDRDLTRFGAVERTHRLIAGHDTSGDRKSREQLLEVAWCSYMLSGREELLTTIAAISQELPPDEPSADPMIALYLETLPSGEDRRLPLAGEATASDGPVADHARARAGWLAQLVRPLLYGSTSAWFSTARLQGAAAMEDVAKRVLRRIGERRDTAYESLDYATLGIVCIWCALRDRHHEPITPRLAEQVLQARAQASRRLGERSRPGTGQNFLLDGLLHQVEAINAESVDALDDLHIMWQNLELYELADIAALARNLFAESGHAEADEDVAEYLVGLDDIENRPMNRAISELMVGIGRLDENLASSGTPLIQAACVVIDSELGPVLTFELCKLLAIRDFETSSNERERVLAQALEPPQGCPGVFAVPDADVADRLRPLLNHAHDPESEVLERLRELTLQRRDAIENPWYADLVDQRLEYGEIGYRGPPDSSVELAELLERWRERIWRPAMQLAVVEEDAHREIVRVANSNPSRQADVVYEYGFDDAPRASVTPQFLASYASKTRSTYTFILMRAWSTVKDDGAGVLEDATRLLRECEDHEMVLGYVLLASTVCEYRASLGEEATADFACALAILRDHIGSYEDVISPSKNRSIYESLAAHESTSSAVYLAKAREWRLIDERLEEERLFLRVADQQSFEVFWHHFTRRKLPCDMSPAEVMTPCPQIDEHPLQPLLSAGNGRTRLSGSYLRVGHDIFHLHPKLGKYDDLRSSMQRAANENVRGLYDMLIDLSGSYPELRQLFERQRKRFDEM